MRLRPSGREDPHEGRGRGQVATWPDLAGRRASFSAMLCRTLIPGSAGRIDQCLSMRRALGEEIMFSIADTHVARRSALRGTTALGALGMALLTAAPAWAQTAGTAPAVTAVAQDDPQAAPQD